MDHSIYASTYTSYPGENSQYTWPGSDRASYCEPKKYMSLKFYTQKNTSHQNFLSKKIQDLNTSKLINSTKQTLRPKNIRVKSLDPKKNTEGVNFQPKNYVWPPSCKLGITPPPPPPNSYQGSIFPPRPDRVHHILACAFLPMLRRQGGRCLGCQNFVGRSSKHPWNCDFHFSKGTGSRIL